VDAVVPETPDLADRGDEHVPGGLEAGVDELLAEAFDRFEEADGPLATLGYDAVPLSPVVAALLDFAGVELLARRRAEDGLRSPDEAFAGGPFCRLSRRDRLRAVRLLEDDGVLASVGTVNYLTQAVVTVTQLAYYSDWGGSEQGWEQAGYPGPSDGYAVSMGYEVDSFEEDDY
jgi:hypothetical protein